MVKPMGQRNVGLNGVRPRRPEQFLYIGDNCLQLFCVSMESGLEDRNNIRSFIKNRKSLRVSMESGLEDRNNCMIGLSTKQ